MHTPITTLKTAARDPEATTVVDLVRRLFNLHDKEPARHKAKSDAPRKSEAEPRHNASLTAPSSALSS